MKTAASVGSLAFVAVLSGCATKPAPVAPPITVAIPPMPRPPLDAPVKYTPPPVDAAGVRETVNKNISPEQMAWNLRSAFNVAALNCLDPEHVSILQGYKDFLKNNAKSLTAMNKAVDKRFGGTGREAVRARETYMTKVYNFYALPSTLPQFCDAVVTLVEKVKTEPPKDIPSFAQEQLPLIDNIFLQFFDSYDQYRRDLAAWQARYAPGSAGSVPVAVVRADGIGSAP